MWRLGNGSYITHLGYLAGRSYVGGAPARLGGIRPTLGVMSLAEAKHFLNGGVVGVDKYQMMNGSESVAQGLLDGRLRYIERDPKEKWMSVNEIWAAGGGDCEDLASALVAELQLAGHRARVKIIKGGGNVAHAIAELGTGYDIDPSVVGGMKSRLTNKVDEATKLKGLI